jgi:hypothetical protein
MSRSRVWFFSAVVLLMVSAPLRALTYEVGGCKTSKSYVNFTTISAAVIGVPAGSTIQICPGVYPEQVTITQPLTLKGITFNNANRSVITINPNGNLAPNVTSVIGESLYAQLLVQNINPIGPVNIIGITVDGNGGPQQGCTDASGFAGIFYASGTTGTVNEVTARNQIGGCGLGAGIWVENGASPTQSITVENSSVRNMDGPGIIAVSIQNPATLVATIRGNFVNSANSLQGNTEAVGIWAEGESGTVTNNLITGSGIGILSSGGADNLCCANTISGNTLADIPGSPGTAIALSAPGDSTAQLNKISNVSLAFDLASGRDTVKSNASMNTMYAVWFFCNAGNTVSGNTLSDSTFGFLQAPSLITGNAIYNIDTVQTGSCP